MDRELAGLHLLVNKESVTTPAAFRAPPGAPQLQQRGNWRREAWEHAGK